MIPEPTVAAQLGLSRIRIAEMRRDLLEKEVDYVYEKNQIFITDKGVASLKRLLGCPEVEGKTLVEVVTEEPVLMTVTRPPLRNRHIIEACPKNGGDAVRVRVRDNANFLPGMEIKARPGGEYGDVYELVGRAPRWKGRW